MEKQTQQIIGWSGIVLGVLVALNEALVWPGALQYLWAVLVLILGIWVLAIKK